MGFEVASRGSAAALFLLLAVTAHADDVMRFDFTKGGNVAGHPLYDASRGFGFEPGPAAQFSVRVPEGNYFVTLKFKRGRPHQALTVLAEQRRVMVEDTKIGQRDDQVVRFVVNVRTPTLPPLPENATGGISVALKPREIGGRTWDDKLNLEFKVWPAVLRSIEVAPAPLPTLYLAGDSTVTDQGTAPSASWGQFLTRYFDDGIAVANHAESGESLKSFVTEMRLDKLLSNLRAGDWVMIQFGHNDQKTQWPQTYVDASSTYRAWLRTYVAEVRRRGATPLLVTSPERRNFDTEGRIRPTLAEYAEAMRVVAREEKVALLDLNASSVRVYEALGPAVSPAAFADGGNDKTHHNEYGARLLARAVIEALRTSDLTLTAGLVQHIAADAGRFDPSHPPLPN
jgi:lysophospholipase L1-like esterase